MPDADWLPAAELADLPPGAVVEAVVGDAIIALVNVHGDIHALDGMCAHQGGPLGRGKLEGCTLTCPWHGWQYDATTGQQLLSKHIHQRRYPVRIEGGTILVRLSDG